MLMDNASLACMTYLQVAMKNILSLDEYIMALTHKTELAANESQCSSPWHTLHLRQVTCQQGNFDEAEDPDDYEGESDADSDASDDAAAGRGNLPLSQLYNSAVQESSF